MTIILVIMAVAVIALVFQVFSLIQTNRELTAATVASNAARARFADQATARTREAEILRAVMDGMSDGVWLTDKDGAVSRHNNALKELLYAGQDLIGQRPLALVRNPSLHQAVERACKEGQRCELELSLEGVRPRVLAVSVFPLGAEDGGSAAVFSDVTELRKLEKLRQEFVANVSHELRTPITAIMGYAETLLGGALKDEAHAPQMVEVIHRQSERLSLLVNDLLDLSRLDANELSLTIKPMPLAPLARRAAEAVAPRAQAKRIALAVDVDQELSAPADEQAIEQVLLNLLDNAVKYTPEGGSVSLTGGLDAGRAKLCVRDTGLGIEPQHLPRLFERFYRVDRGRSREMGGTGLGLSIVKHLVQAMKGEVQVSSQPGVGSVFSVLLPSARTNPADSG